MFGRSCLPLILDKSRRQDSDISNFPKINLMINYTVSKSKHKPWIHLNINPVSTVNGGGGSRKRRRNTQYKINLANAILSASKPTSLKRINLPIGPNLTYNLKLEFGVKRNPSSEPDIDNLLKPVVDAIKDFYGIDDRNILFIKAHKVRVDNTSLEYISFRLTEYRHEEEER